MRRVRAGAERAPRATAPDGPRRRILDEQPANLQQFVCEFYTQPDLEAQVEDFMAQKV